MKVKSTIILHFAVPISSDNSFAGI